MKAGGSRLRRIGNACASALDPRVYLQGLRLLHHANYTHVSQLRLASIGRDVRMAPNVSFTNGERVSIGDGALIGAHCHLWAGNTTGRVIIGPKALFGPEVFLTASNYQLTPGTAIVDQDTDEADVVIGAGTWLGARVMVMAGVTIGDGAVIGAGSIVTRSVPANAIAVGVPAKVVAMRDGSPVATAAAPKEVAVARA
jgi:acetyltransferase-like isoleucine patch superfamily enzyme